MPSSPDFAFFLKLMSYNPIHPHCGPFNRVSKKRPLDPVDAACWQHDRGYGRLGAKAYFRYNRYDRKFIRDMDKQPGFAPKLYSSFFKVKRFLSQKNMPAVKRYLSNEGLPEAKRPRFYGGNNVAGPMAAWSQPPSFPKIKSMPRRYGSRVYRRKASVRRRAVRRRPTFTRSRKARSKKVFRRNVRKGFKKYRKPKRRQAFVSYVKRGSVKTVENGGILSDPQCLFLGQSLAFNQMYDAVCRAIIRELFRQKGELITDFTDDWLGGAIQFRISYKYGLCGSTGLSQGTYDFPATTTYEGLAQGLKNSFISNFSTGLEYTVYDIWMNCQVSPFETVAIVNLNQCDIHFYCKSMLKIQNGTSGKLGTVEEDDDQMTDIHRRPVVGKIYYQPRQISGFLPNNRPNRGATTEPLYTGYMGDCDTGIISAVNADSLTVDTKKPPPGYFFRASARSVVIQPGEIKRFYLKYSKKMSSQSWWTKLADFVTVSPVGTQQVPLGNAVMVGLEKEIDTRSTEADISIGYQIEQTYCCALRLVMPKAARLLEVN